MGWEESFNLKKENNFEALKKEILDICAVKYDRKLNELEDYVSHLMENLTLLIQDLLTTKDECEEVILESKKETEELDGSLSKLEDLIANLDELVKNITKNFKRI